MQYCLFNLKIHRSWLVAKKETRQGGGIGKKIRKAEEKRQGGGIGMKVRKSAEKRQGGGVGFKVRKKKTSSKK